MIGGAHQHRVVRPALGDRPADPVDRRVHLGVQPVVQVAVALRVAGVGPVDHRRRAVAGRIGLPERDLCGGLAGQVLVGGGRRGHVRRIQRRGLQRAAAQPAREQHDVVRVDEAGHQQEWTQRTGIAGAASRVTIVEPRDDAVGGQRVSAHTRVARQRTVRLRADPPREAERRKRISVEIPLHRDGVDGTGRVVGRQHLPVGVVQIGMRDVPLAVVVGVVTRGAKPVAQRRHLTLAQPAHAGVVGHLAQAIGLGDAMQVGVVPGENGWATGCAGQRAGVVPRKTDAVLVEPLAAVQRAVAPGQHLGRLVGRDRAFLVGHQDDDVGLVSHQVSPIGWPGRRASGRIVGLERGMPRVRRAFAVGQSRFRLCW